MPDEEFESRVLRFEQDWRLHGPHEIAGYLGDPSPTAGSERHRLLVELICIDLEYRWRDAGSAGAATLRAIAPQWVICYG